MVGSGRSINLGDGQEARLSSDMHEDKHLFQANSPRQDTSVNYVDGIAARELSFDNERRRRRSSLQACDTTGIRFRR